MQATNTPDTKKKALIVEGGGMRGVFTAGVLDAFHDKRFRPFHAYYGVSAGALNLTSFLSGQRGRNLQIYTRVCQDPEFISLSRFLKGGHLFDLDFFFEKIQRQHSLHLPRLHQALQTHLFYAVTTCLENSAPTYLSINPDTSTKRLLNILKASSALPMIYRDPVTIDSQDYMDGSLSAPLPVLQALADGYRDILLIRTRPVSHQKTPSTSGRMLAWQYRNQPAIAQLIRQQPTVYNNSINELLTLENSDDVNILQIAPTKPLSASRSSRDRTKLVADYHLGYAEGYTFVEKLTKSLKTKCSSSAKLVEPA